MAPQTRLGSHGVVLLPERAAGLCSAPENVSGGETPDVHVEYPLEHLLPEVAAIWLQRSARPMKNEKKHPQNNQNEKTPKSTPSQEQGVPTPPELRDLTDADLEQVQGGVGLSYGSVVVQYKEQSSDGSR